MSIEETSFEKAINISIVLCNAWENGEVSDEVFADKVYELFLSREGARAFLAVSLSKDGVLMERLPEALIFQLRAAGEIVIDLTVRNLAMSSAMAISHTRNGNFSQVEGSKRVTARCIDLLRRLEANLVRKYLATFLEAISGKGPEVNFFERWNYDLEQKKAIALSLKKVSAT